MSHSSFGSVFCDEIMLSGFGRNLSSLTLKSCKNIDLADLAPMTELEELIIDKTCTMKESQTPIQVDPFSPCLKKLMVQICLGLSSSRIFGCKRPALIELNLNCLHIRDTHANGHEITWEELPKMWPNLRRLSLNFNSHELKLD